MLSKPPDWKFTKKSILKEISQDGDRSLQAGLKKLQDAGYLTVSGKVPIKFFEKKYFGFEADPGAGQKQEVTAQ